MVDGCILRRLIEQHGSMLYDTPCTGIWIARFVEKNQFLSVAMLSLDCVAKYATVDDDLTHVLQVAECPEWKT